MKLVSSYIWNCNTMHHVIQNTKERKEIRRFVFEEIELCSLTNIFQNSSDIYSKEDEHCWMIMLIHLIIYKLLLAFYKDCLHILLYERIKLWICIKILHTYAKYIIWNGRTQLSRFLLSHFMPFGYAISTPLLLHSLCYLCQINVLMHIWRVLHGLCPDSSVSWFFLAL